MQSNWARYRNLCSNFTKLLLLILSPICGLKLSKKNTYSHTPKQVSCKLSAFIALWHPLCIHKQLGLVLEFNYKTVNYSITTSNIFNMHGYKPVCFQLQSKANLILCCGCTAQGAVSEAWEFWMSFCSDSHSMARRKTGPPTVTGFGPQLARNNLCRWVTEPNQTWLQMNYFNCKYIVIRFHIATIPQMKCTVFQRVVCLENSRCRPLIRLWHGLSLLSKSPN